MKPLPLTTALALASSLAAQTTYYVDVNGVPPGTGTQVDPFTTLQAALDDPGLAAGDTILVAPGVYVENVVAPILDVTIASTGGPIATEIRPAGPGSILTLGGGTLDGFSVIGSQDRGVWASRHVHFNRCIVYDCSEEGIGSSYGATITQSTIVDNREGVRAWPGADIDIFDSILWSNTVVDIADSGFGTTVDVVHCIYRTATLAQGSSSVWGSSNELPEFWRKKSDDFHLRPLSPAIGMGSAGGTVGALEYDDTYAPELPRAYCQSKMNSLGCLPTIGYVGTASANGPFDITLANTLPGKQGLLFYGFRNKAAVYQGGYLCVVAPARRTPVQTSAGTSGCAGTYSYDFAARIASGIDPVLAPGQAVFAQYWYRDPAEPSGFTTGRSDALGFTVQP